MQVRGTEICPALPRSVLLWQRIALFIVHVVDRGIQLLMSPQPSLASFSRPRRLIAIQATCFFHLSRRMCFQSAQYDFRVAKYADRFVNMISSYVAGPELPTMNFACLANSLID